MKLYLLDTTSARHRNRRLVWTMIGSLLFHGALVGGAALFRRAPGPPERQYTCFFPTPDDPGYLPPPGPEPSLSTPEPEPFPTPLVLAPETPADTPPTIEDPDMIEPIPATPAPVVHQQAAQPRPHNVPVPSTRTGSVTGPATGQQTSRVGNGGGQPAGIRWNTSSRPMYPPTLRAIKVQGSGTVRITTDASGRVVDAVIVQSTGNSALDANTCQHARSSWSGPASTSTNVPFTYRLQ